MLRLSSLDRAVAAIGHAHEVALAAYLLRPGPVADALCTAARRGSHVTVRLDGDGAADPSGYIAAENRAMVARLRAAGADAAVVAQADAAASFHAKALLADDRLYLDDCNWGGARDTIVRDDSTDDARAIADLFQDRADAPSTSFATGKCDALALEASLLAVARAGDDVVVESESFGCATTVFHELMQLAQRGVHARMLVTRRLVSANAKEKQSLERLAQAGVDVRTTTADEKIALVGSRAWIGSANASAAFGEQQFDWGARTRTQALVRHLRAVFERRWARAQNLSS